MPIELTLLLDYEEEGWPSMELVGQQLARHLEEEFRGVVSVAARRPAFRRRLGMLPGKLAFNADRFLNRYHDYPRWLSRFGSTGFYHLSDHSYAHLASVLPPARTGVYLHDLDAFRCLLEPEAEPRPWWFRKMTSRVLAGLQRASLVFHSTQVVRDAVVRHGLVPEERLVYAPYGYTADFSPDGATAIRGRPYLLHVGSCIPRKRIDVLLDVYAACRAVRPELLLVKVGGEWRPEHERVIEERGLRGFISHERDVDVATLAALYRGASCVVLTSEAEGFGLPLLEALACGAPVVASDIPPFREIGGRVCTYAALADSRSWVAPILAAVEGGASARRERSERARLFSWTRHARTIGDAYLRLAGLSMRHGGSDRDQVSA